MNRVLKTLFAITLLLLVGACDSTVEKTDGGGVILRITEWDGVPVLIGVNSTSILQIAEIEVTNLPRIPGGATSNLMDVEIVSYEVTFTRADSGTRIPTPYVAGAGGYAPINGNDTFANLVVMSQDQLGRPPLSDLLFNNGGVDSETGLDRITLNLHVRFFGRTLSGDEVETSAIIWTIDFVA